MRFLLEHLASLGRAEGFDCAARKRRRRPSRSRKVEARAPMSAIPSFANGFSVF